MASTSDDYENKIPLYVSRGNVEMLKLIRKEIGEMKFRSMCNKIEADGDKMLHVAVLAGRFETCKFLVEEVKIDINEKSIEGNTPLQVAVVEGKHVTAEYLIQHGANVKMGDHMGLTPLHVAMNDGNLDLVKMLVYKGADVEADSIIGRPLHCAAIFGTLDMIQFLLKRNAKPSSVSNFSCMSPLMSAIKSVITNKVDCVELLLKAGADPNMLVVGLSPLAYALEVKANCCIGPLLAAGADVDLVSSRDMRPIEHAADVNNLEGVLLLLKARPRILATRNWKFRVMMRNIHSSESKEKRDLYVKNLKQKGDELLDNRYKNYSAMEVYNEAMFYNHTDVKLLANRSLCWLRLGERVPAYRAADLCVESNTNWDKGYFRMANAWSQLREYRESANMFRSGFKLNPENYAVAVEDDIKMLRLN